MLAVTMEDLYPQEDWNFVFGEARPAWRAGVFSFARYSPLFLEESSQEGVGERPLCAAERLQLLRRSCRVLAHETLHLLGLEHCMVLLSLSLALSLSPSVGLTFPAAFPLSHERSEQPRGGRLTALKPVSCLSAQTLRVQLRSTTTHGSAPAIRCAARFLSQERSSGGRGLDGSPASTRRWVGKHSLHQSGSCSCRRDNSGAREL